MATVTGIPGSFGTEMENNKKIILDLCGGSGSWSQPYQDAGDEYDVRLITLPRWDITKIEFEHKSMRFLRQDTHFDDGLIIFYEDVYGILAAPPCTEFSIAKNGSHRKRDLQEGMKTIEACLRVIWKCQEVGKLQFWALENPVGLLRRFLGNPPYTFYQWWFGDKGIKRTDVWGKFHFPKQQIFERPDDPYFIKQYKSGKKNQFAWAAPECPEWAKEYVEKQPNKRAALRAITPPGFANAFYKANK